MAVEAGSESRRKAAPPGEGPGGSLPSGALAIGRRFLTLRDTAFRNPASYFHRYSSLGDTQARERASTIWREINEVNLVENILPTRERAHLILEKGHDHVVQRVKLRKL